MQDDRRDQLIEYIQSQRKRFARKNQPEISTADFAVAAIRLWLLKSTRTSYRHCTDLLIQANAGGANACDSWLWKVELQKLAD